MRVRLCTLCCVCRVCVGGEEGVVGCAGGILLRWQLTEGLTERQSAEARAIAGVVGRDG